MMEGLHLSPEEEYIWAMRAATFVESDSELWKKRQSSGKIRKESSFTAEKLNAQITKVLSSLVPDEIIYNVDDYNVKNYEACLLFGDVSGFTDLSEKYNLTGKGGPSRLTQVLNGYIGSMVQEILSHNGDLLKFSGDAFLAMWKTGGGDSMQDCVHQALDCAVLIQKSYGTYETDVGVLLKVKLAISAGGVLFSLIGDEMMSHYVIVGQPIWDVKAAEHKSSAGEIIVSPTAWHFVNPNEYTSEFMSDGLHVKVLGVGPNWRHTQKSGRARRTSKSNLIGASSTIYLRQDSESSTDSDEIINENEQNDFALRPSVDDAARLNLKEKLRKFIILPVMRGIDLEEPLEYLTEMRQIVILFINVVTVKIELKKFLSVVNDAYIIVCRLVNEVQGCVNKVSLFDKDLMFLVIFGLRGYKHDLESQIGLHCARRCFKAISNLENVKCTSIGVTTGMAYCGVVGHTLRREYTVISTIVNKGARIMVAYPNRVTCDRDTFIHSKLESRFFALQEYKELKGIPNVGPIYEFSEELGKFGKKRHLLNPYPVLGRDKEQALYLKMLGTYLVHAESRIRGQIDSSVPPHPCALLIRGMSRQGKTRLSDELIYITLEDLPVSRVEFEQRGQMQPVPYAGIKEILKPHLDFDEKVSATQREQILGKRLAQMKVPEFLCCLNDIFQVNFRMTPLYIKRTEEERLIIQKKMIKQLFYGCFMDPWVIVVDNVNYMDAESWILLQEVLNTDSCFFVFTSNSDKEYGVYESFRDDTFHRRIHKIDLPPIDKWFFVGIACQILNVIAIPPILEKNIEQRSQGNPGWIESFLISMLQAGGVDFDNMTRGGAYAKGLVLPSIEMLVRVPLLEIGRMDRLQTQLTKKEHEVVKWEMFRQCYKDSKIKFIQMSDPSNDRIPVAILTEQYQFCANAGEMSEDALILKTFDSLTPYEQQLLKTASVLGDIFTRNMLFYIMNLTASREAALAIKKLFELRIIACAQGDFTIGQDRMMDCYLIFTNRFVNPATITEVKCFCEGLSVPANIEDLPKYANCGYIRFVLSSFRETTYDLLIDTQRRELHKKSLRYLEKEVRRCQSCGGGFFVKFMGVRYDDGLIRNRLERLGKVGAPAASGSSSFNSRRSVPSSIGSSNKNFKPNDVNLTSKESEMLKFGLPPCFFPNKLKSMRQKHSITRTFSGADFTQCQCNQILNTMYSYMLYHAHGAGSYDKIIDALLEYAYVCITERNIPHAIIILSEALHTVEDKTQKINTEPGAEWKSKLIRGKIKALMGYSRFVLGQPHEALKLFRRAMVFYGYPFPSTSGAVLWQLKYKRFKQKFALAYFPAILAGTMRGYQAEFCDNLAECLGFMYILFKQMKMWEAAELAAVWELNRALMSEMDFYTMAVAYSNVLEVSMQSGNHEACLILEVHALQLCYRKITNIEINELQSVAMMYTSIFRTRLFRSELDRAINIGYTMLRICNTIKAIMMTLSILPNVIQGLLLSERVLEAVTLLFELDYYGEEDTDNSGKTWYFGISLTIQICTGYTVISYYTCRDYFRIEGETMLTFRDPESEFFYFTALWLWCVRNECWEQASIWYYRCFSNEELDLEERVTNLFTELSLIEGLLIYLVLRVDKRNVVAISQICVEINSMFQAVKKKLTYAKIVAPRYWHLRAYYRAIGYDDNKTYSLLEKARRLAVKFTNVYETGWIEHSKKAWTNNLPRFARNFWVEHCFDPDKELDFHELEDEVPLGYYSLPLPRKPLFV